ncbi:hypothetical protein PSKAS_52810 [Peribacillus sp. N1]
MDVDIKTNTRVGVDVSANQLTADYYSVIIAIGKSDVPKLGIEA